MNEQLWAAASSALTAFLLLFVRWVERRSLVKKHGRNSLPDVCECCGTLLTHVPKYESDPPPESFEPYERPTRPSKRRLKVKP